MRKEQIISFFETIEEMEGVYSEGSAPYYWTETKHHMLDAALEAYPAYVNDRDLVILYARLGSNAHLLENIGDAVREDPDAALAILTSPYFGNAYSFSKATTVKSHQVGTTLARDTAFVRACIEKVGSHFIQLDKDLQQDKSLVLAAAGKGKLSLQYVPKEFRGDIDVVTEAMRNAPLDLAHADPALLKKHPELLLSALEILVKTPYTTEAGIESFFKNSVPRNFRSDRDFMRQAIAIHPETYNYAFRTLRDGDLLFRYVAAGGKKDVEDKLTPEQANDKTYMLKLLRTTVDPDEIACAAGNDLKDDKEWALEVVRTTEWGLARLGPKMRDDIEVVNAALSHHPGEKKLRYASERIRTHPELLCVPEYDDPSKAGGTSETVSRADSGGCYEV